MKIVGFLTHNNRGGAQKAMAKLQNNLRNKNLQFEVVYLYGKNGDVMDNGKVLVPSGVPVTIRYFLIIYNLLAYLINNKPDAIISFLPLANALTSITSLMCGVNIRIVSHRNPVWTYNKALRVLDKLLGKLGLYTFIVANSEAVKDSVLDYPKAYLDKVRIINNGVEFPKEIVSQEKVIKKYGLGYSPFVLSVGRLSEQKRFDLLIEVFSKIPKGRLVIAGHGGLYSQLKDQISLLQLEERVLLIGNVPSEDVLSLLKLSDIYVQASEFEGQSNALLEALMAKCTIVSNDIPPQREVLTNIHGELAGILIKANDVSHWVRELKKVIEDKELRDKYSDLSYARSKDFTVDKMAKQFLELCER